MEDYSSKKHRRGGRVLKGPYFDDDNSDKQFRLRIVIVAVVMLIVLFICGLKVATALYDFSWLTTRPTDVDWQAYLPAVTSSTPSERGFSFASRNATIKL